MIFDELQYKINIRKQLLPLLQLIITCLVQFIIPSHYYYLYLFILFGTGYITSLIFIDHVQLIPFQTTHNIWLSVFTIPQIFVIYQVLNNGISYININNVFTYLIQILGIFFIFGFLLSNNKILSYFGSIERGIGIQFFILLFINIISVLLIYQVIGLKQILSILYLSQVFEVFIIEKQRQQHKKIHDWKLTYVLEMGGRYVGTLSNPIHTAAYLTMIIPLLLFIVSNNIFSVMLYSGLYLLISYGIYNTQGRASTISYSLESLFIIFYLQSMWKNINPKYLIIYSIIPLISLILYYNKFAKDNIIRFKQLKEKIVKETANEDYFKKYVKNNRIILWKEGINIILNKFPFIGYGLQNIQNQYNKYSRYLFKLYYNDKTNDSSHNFFIDIGLQFGFLGLLLISTIFFQIGYELFFFHQYIFQISYIVFIIEFMFAFPLQQNYMLLFVILILQGISIGGNITDLNLYFFINKYFILSLQGVQSINLFFYFKENKMLQYLQLQTQLNNQGQRYQINLYTEQMNIMMYDSRPWIYVKALFFDKIAQNKQLQSDDLILLLNIFETHKKRIVNQQENKQQVMYIPINVLLTLINMYKKNIYVDTTKFQKMQKDYLYQQLLYDPYSIDLRTLYRTYFAIIKDYDNYIKVGDKVALDLVKLYDIRPNMHLMIKDYIDRRETGHIIEQIRKLYKLRFEK